MFTALVIALIVMYAACLFGFVYGIFEYLNDPQAHLRRDEERERQYAASR